MRRKDKEIRGMAEISAIIRSCQVCRVGLAKENRPYIVPVSFGYDGDAIYFHTVAKQGMKIEYILANSQVCFEFENNVKVVADEEKPCNWSFEFQSVIGFGQVEELESKDDKIIGLNHIMAQYSDKEWGLEGVPMNGVSVWKITIESITGKQSQNFVE